MNHCTHPGCGSVATSRSPLYCWGHYVDHVLLMNPCPGAPKRVRLTLYVSAEPLRRYVDALVARARAETPTNDGSNRTFNHVATEHHLAFWSLKQVYDRDLLRWDMVDNVCGKLGVHPASLYGYSWTAMDVEDAA